LQQSRHKCLAVLDRFSDSQGEACPIWASLGAFSEQGAFQPRQKTIKFLKKNTFFYLIKFARLLNIGSISFLHLFRLICVSSNPLCLLILNKLLQRKVEVLADLDQVKALSSHKTQP
jgi:hypothetical protein